MDDRFELDCLLGFLSSECRGDEVCLLLLLIRWDFILSGFSGTLVCNKHSVDRDCLLLFRFNAEGFWSEISLYTILY